MKAVLNATGEVVGVFSDVVFIPEVPATPGNPPTGGVQAHLLADGLMFSLVVLGGSYTIQDNYVPPTTQEDAGIAAAELEDQLDAELDALARSWGYKSANRLVSYYNDPNPTWQAEARAFVNGRSAWWQEAQTLQNAWRPGDPIPTFAQVLASMPTINRP